MRSFEPVSVILVLTAVLLATISLAACSADSGEEGAAPAPAEERGISDNDFESGDTAGWEKVESEDEQSADEDEKDEESEKDE